tara:strand:+ start:170 stop:1933 length:1764 start_codon:yes stop_codon:yes gene_type:complete
MADKKIVIQAEIKSTGVGQLSKEVDGVTKSTEGLRAGFDGATVAADGTATGVKGIGTALKAAGIGILLAAIALAVNTLMGAWNMMTDAIMKNKVVSEEYEKITKKLQMVIDAATNAIVKMYLELFTNAEKFDKVVKHYELMFDTMVTGAEILVNAVITLKDAFDLWYEAIQQIINLDFNFDSLAQKGQDFANSMKTQFGLLGKQADNVTNIVKNYPDAVTQGANAWKETGEAIVDVTGKIVEMDVKTDEQIKKEMEARKKAHERRMKQLEKEKESRKEMFELFQDLARDNNARDFELAEGKRARMLKDLEIELKEREKAIDKSAASEKQKEQLKFEAFQNFNHKRNELLLQFQDDDDKKAADELQKLTDIQNETTLMLIESLEQRALKELEIQRDKELKSVEMMDNAEAMKEAIMKKYDQKFLETKKKNLDKEFRWEEMTQKQKLGLASSTAGNLAKILGEESAAGKAFAITQATIDTYQGATAAYASMAKVPVVGPALGAAAAGAAIAAGLANVKAIMSANDSGGGAAGGGGEVDANMSGPAPQMMSGAFELGDMTEPEPVKAFVVTDEMTNSQDQLANIRRKATI